MFCKFKCHCCNAARASGEVALADGVPAGAPARAPAGSPTAAAGSSGDPPVPKGKAKSSAAKGKAKMKAAAKPLKVGVLELARTKASDIKDALPRYNRSETRNP